MSVVERLIGVLEIGAGVLEVGIEKEFVQTCVEVVVARDIAFGAPAIVALVQGAKRNPDLIERLDPRQTFYLGKIPCAQLQ